MGFYSPARGIFMAVALAVTSASYSTTIQTDVLSKPVKYDDLDLNRAPGVERLFNRILHASEQVCAPYNRRDLAFRQRWKTCVNDSIDRAVAAVNQPNLTAFRQSQNGVKRLATLASGSR